MRGALLLQEVKSLSCGLERPDCPAAHISSSDIGSRGNSLTGGRFKAVIGINRGENDIPSALSGLGIQRWIVDLPRPGEGNVGHLILNPTDEEVVGYTQIRNIAGAQSSLRDAIGGCIVVGDARQCGPMILDTGAPGIQIMNASENHRGIEEGATATIGFYSSNTPCAAEAIVLGRQAQVTQFRYVNNSRIRNALIIAGTVPFFAFNVLYDNNSSSIGLKTRSPMSDGPSGQVLCHN